MLNQVEMAIEELRHKVASAAGPSTTVHEKPPVPAPSVLKLEPNFYGIGINLPALWQRTKSWFGKGKS